MPPPRLAPHDLIRSAFAGAILFSILAVRGDAGSAVFDLCRSVPNLEVAVARHLVLDDDPAFRRYCKVVRLATFREDYFRINFRIWSVPPDSYAVVFHRLSPYLERMARESAALYGRREWLRDLDRRRSLGAHGADLSRLIQELGRAREAVTSVQEKESVYRRLIVGFERFGYETGIMLTEGELARTVDQQGRRQEREALLYSALTHARRLEETEMVCQYLGELGYDHMRAGDSDSMLACYMEGISIADRFRFADQASRLRNRVATYYWLEGQLAVAAELLRQAQNVCHAWGAEESELRVLLTGMSLFASLECWDIVRRGSYRLPVLTRKLERPIREREFQLFSLWSRVWDARLLAADGRAAEAAKELSALQGSMRRVTGFDPYASLQAEWAEDLIAAGRPQEALNVAVRGIAYADSFHQVIPATDLALARARAALALHEVDVADTALRDARSRLDRSGPYNGLELSAFDAVEVGIRLARGESREALMHLARGLASLSAAVRRQDAGPHSQMALGQAEALHEMGHRLLANAPASGYHFELYWRSLPALLGRGGADPRSTAIPRPMILDSGPRRTIHVVYAFTADALTRWTWFSGTVRREVLSSNRVECDRLVERAMQLLSRDPESPDAPMPPEVRSACSELGRLLLPPEVRHDPTVRLIVTAEGSIARLPFEVLDVGGLDYEPLLARHDIVYARPVPPLRGGQQRANSIILVGGEETPPLAAVGSEAEQARTALPNARILRSGEISKRALLDSLSRAPIIYVAAHLVRDPEAPLLCYFPMSFGARQDRPEDAYLDLHDIRGTDLTGCELAVLSSCASGEPYVVGGRAGPSMADALLDAGAHAVIHTRWQVRDDRAAVVAPRLAEAWVYAGRDPVSAWCANRRSMMRGPDGWLHPFDWAAWSVTVELPIQPWHAVRGDIMAAHARPALLAHGAPGTNREPSRSRP